MKKIALLISTLTFGVLAFGQQLPQSSMYMMNNYLLNPAEGGTEDFIDLQAGYRTQWVSFDEGKGPKTIYFSGHTPLGKHSVTKDTNHNYNNSELEDFVKPMGYHGVGGVIFSDDAGHFRTVEIKGSYAYHMPMGKNFFLSFGGFLGVKQSKVDEEIEWNSAGQADPIASGNKFSTALSPDLTLGIWGYHKKYYFGISSFQVLGNPVQLAPDGSEGELQQHYYFTGGYKLDIVKSSVPSEEIFLVPSTLIKVLPGVPMTLDLNAKINFYHKYWGGASFRLGNEAESLVLLAGITLKDLVDIGYSYDITLNGLNQVSNGSHEIMVGLRLPNHQHHAPPKQFW
jgi:type IX secretion system PorP/SprF family membrane protein